MPHREKTPSNLEYYFRDDSPKGGTGRLMSESKRRKAKKKRKRK